MLCAELPPPAAAWDFPAVYALLNEACGHKIMLTTYFGPLTGNLGLALIRRAVGALGEKRILLSSSCSLLHCPVDLEEENALPRHIRERMAFAVQKCAELPALRAAARQSASPAPSGARPAAGRLRCANFQLLQRAGRLSGKALSIEITY